MPNPFVLKLKWITQSQDSKFDTVNTHYFSNVDHNSKCYENNRLTPFLLVIEKKLHTLVASKHTYTNDCIERRFASLLHIFVQYIAWENNFGAHD